MGGGELWGQWTWLHKVDCRHECSPINSHMSDASQAVYLIGAVMRRAEALDARMNSCTRAHVLAHVPHFVIANTLDHGL
jgi:hypothetical protein